MVAEHPEDYVKELRDKFKWQEYVVFAVVLSLSAAIGIFHGFFSKQAKIKTNDEFLMGGRSMAAWPVALSIMCSFISALTVLGNPMETYLYGTQYMTIIFSFIPLTLILQYIYVPVYFNLQLTSGYKYFEIRFNNVTRLILSFIHCFYIIFYLALVVYGPSLALKQVTGFETRLSVGIIFLICIFYSTLGGFRAVIWTDALQGIIMIVSIAVVAIKGTIDVGGFSDIWEKLDDTGRLSIFRYDPDPRTRHSIWTVWLGGVMLYLTMMAGMQANIQRFSSMPTLKSVIRSLWLNCLVLTIVIFLCTYVGVVIFARFYTCDPSNAKLVEMNDQIFPLFVMDIVGDIPCLPGLFVAGITCASLSTVSSGLNAMAALVIEDFVKTFKPNLSTTLLFNLSRIVSVATGVISFLFVFVVEKMGDIFPAAVSLVGVLTGPTLGLFSLGMMFPWANSLGSLIGCMASYVFTIILGAASAIEGANKNLPSQVLSLSTENCTEFFSNMSTITPVNHTFSSADTWKDLESSAWIKLSSISYLYFPLVGTFSTIIFGLICSGIVSLLGLSKNEKPVRKDCISPPFYSLWKKLFPEQMARLISETEDEDVDRIRYDSTGGVSNNGFIESLGEKIKL